MTAVLELEGVTKEYAGGVCALAGVDLRVDPGELVGIVGPSGRARAPCCM